MSYTHTKGAFKRDRSRRDRTNMESDNILTGKFIHAVNHRDKKNIIKVVIGKRPPETRFGERL